MTSNDFNKYDSIVVGTGNILENEEFKKAKNPTQEVSHETKIDTASILIIAALITAHSALQKIKRE
jgi:hypothetical protein